MMALLGMALPDSYSLMIAGCMFRPCGARAEGQETIRHSVDSDSKPPQHMPLQCDLT
jgi:hypothetical protein